jgi:hypothetical protein
LDAGAALEWFLSSGVLKKIESLRMQERAKAAFQIDELQELISWGLLVVVLQRFHQESNPLGDT